LHSSDLLSNDDKKPIFTTSNNYLKPTKNPLNPTIHPNKINENTTRQTYQTKNKKKQNIGI